MLLRSVLVDLVALAALGGCSSLSSTYVGDATPGAKFEGMPIVVQRPKYMKVTTKEVIYQVLANRTVSSNGQESAGVESLGERVKVTEVSTEIVSVGEVYALDLKRPASGTTEYAVEFDPNGQYPKKVGAKLEDKTITDAANAIKTVGEIFKPASTGPTSKGTSADVTRIAETIVRIELRSLADPTTTVARLYPPEK